MKYKINIIPTYSLSALTALGIIRYTIDPAYNIGNIDGIFVIKNTVVLHMLMKQWKLIYALQGLALAIRNKMWLINHEYPMHYSHKRTVMCQYRACTGPMLAASAQYMPGTGN